MRHDNRSHHAGRVARGATLWAFVMMLTGCAPKFVQEPEEPKRFSWRERDVVVHSNVLAPVNAREIVLTDESTATYLSALERVRWLDGINLNSTRIQRSTERKQAGHVSSFESISPLVQYTLFEVNQGQLTIHGQLSLKNFQPKTDRRYIVDFLHADDMDLLNVNLMASAWNDLAKKLLEKGVKRENLIMGGSRYRQKNNAIMLLEIGS